MWPFGRKKSERVAISLTPQNLTCGVIKAEKNSYTLQAYKRTHLTRLESAQAVLFNPTAISRMITNFISEHNAHNYPVDFSVSGPKVFEKVVHTKTASPTKQELDFPELRTLTWESLYLCPSAQGGFDFFVCGLKPEHLFSYQLLALSSGLNLATLTTQKGSLLHLYRHLRGPAFRQSELATTLVSKRYELDNLVTYEQIEEIMQIAPGISVEPHEEYKFLATSLGLFVSGDNT